jgi:hypothetical protein
MQRRSGLALAAMIVGIAGIFLFFVIVPSIVALVLGLVAASQIKNSRGQQTGLGMARAGWILGLIGLLGFAALIVAVVVAEDETAVFDLETGDCVRYEEVDSVEVETVRTLPVVDCTETHTAEVVGIVELNPDRDREYPAESDLFPEAYQACRAEFEDHAGRTLEGTDFDLAPIVADELAWRSERGTVICLAVDIDGGDLSEPIGN